MKMKIKFMAYFIIITIFSVFFAPHTINAENWSDTIDNLNNWNTLRLNCPGSCGTDLPIPLTNDSALSVDNGVLRFPGDSGFDYVDTAIHRSDIAYGFWSWDWQASPGVIRSFDAVEFIMNNANWNLSSSGFTWERTTSYYLTILSRGPDSGSFVGPGLTLLSYKGGSDTGEVLGSHRFSEPIVGTHKIEILRAQSGEFNVYFDDELAINASDNKVITSEEFVIFSWGGTSGYDNITVSNIIPTEFTSSNSAESSTPGFFALLAVPTMGIIVLWRKERKN